MRFITILVLLLPMVSQILTAKDGKNHLDKGKPFNYTQMVLDHLRTSSSKLKLELARVGKYTSSNSLAKDGQTPAEDKIFFPPYKFPFWGLPYGIYSNGGFFNPGLFPFVPGGPAFPPYDGIFGGPFGPGEFPGGGPTPFLTPPKVNATTEVPPAGLNGTGAFPYPTPQNLPSYPNYGYPPQQAPPTPQPYPPQQQYPSAQAYPPQQPYAPQQPYYPGRSGIPRAARSMKGGFDIEAFGGPGPAPPFAPIRIVGKEGEGSYEMYGPTFHYKGQNIYVAKPPRNGGPPFDYAPGFPQHGNFPVIGYGGPPQYPIGPYAIGQHPPYPPYPPPSYGYGVPPYGYGTSPAAYGYPGYDLQHGGSSTSYGYIAAPNGLKAETTTDKPKSKKTKKRKKQKYYYEPDCSCDDDDNTDCSHGHKDVAPPQYSPPAPVPYSAKAVEPSQTSGPQEHDSQKAGSSTLLKSVTYIETMPYSGYNKEDGKGSKEEKPKGEQEQVQASPPRNRRASRLQKRSPQYAPYSPVMLPHPDPRVPGPSNPYNSRYNVPRVPEVPTPSNHMEPPKPPTPPEAPRPPKIPGVPDVPSPPKIQYPPNIPKIPQVQRPPRIQYPPEIQRPQQIPKLQRPQPIPPIQRVPKIPQIPPIQRPQSIPPIQRIPKIPPIPQIPPTSYIQKPPRMPQPPQLPPVQQPPQLPRIRQPAEIPRVQHPPRIPEIQPVIQPQQPPQIRHPPPIPEIEYPPPIEYPNFEHPPEPEIPNFPGVHEYQPFSDHNSVVIMVPSEIAKNAYSYDAGNSHKNNQDSQHGYNSDQDSHGGYSNNQESRSSNNQDSQSDYGSNTDSDNGNHDNQQYQVEGGQSEQDQSDHHKGAAYNVHTESSDGNGEDELESSASSHSTSYHAPISNYEDQSLTTLPALSPPAISEHVLAPSYSEYGPGVQVAAPGYDVQGPGVEAAAPGYSLEGPGFQAAAPGYSVQGPGVQAGAPGYNVQGPGVQAGAPGYNVQGAGIQAGAPGYNVQGPGVEAGAPGYNVQGPGLQAGAPGYSVQGPGLQAGAPGYNVQGPGIHAAAPGYNVQGPGVQAGAPGYNIEAPGIQAGVPGYNIRGPGVQVGAPGYNVQGPGMEAAAPAYNEQGPGLQAGAPAYNEPAPGPQVLPNYDEPYVQIPIHVPPGPPVVQDFKVEEYAVPLPQPPNPGPVLVSPNARQPSYPRRPYPPGGRPRIIPSYAAPPSISDYKPVRSGNLQDIYQAIAKRRSIDVRGDVRNTDRSRPKTKRSSRVDGGDSSSVLTTFDLENSKPAELSYRLGVYSQSSGGNSVSHAVVGPKHIVVYASANATQEGEEEGSQPEREASSSVGERKGGQAIEQMLGTKRFPMMGSHSTPLQMMDGGKESRGLAVGFIEPIIVEEGEDYVDVDRTKRS